MYFFPIIPSVLSYLSPILGTFMCVFILQVMFEQKDQRMSILEQKRVKRSNFGQSKIACRDMDSSCRSMRCIPTKNQRSTCRSMSWPGRSMSRRCKEGKFKSGRSMTNPCRDMTTFMSFYFWQLGLKRTPIVILICSYKKEVIGTF